MDETADDGSEAMTSIGCCSGSFSGGSGQKRQSAETVLKHRKRPEQAPETRSVASAVNGQKRQPVVPANVPSDEEDRRHMKNRKASRSQSGDDHDCRSVSKSIASKTATAVKVVKGCCGRFP